MDRDSIYLRQMLTCCQKVRKYNTGKCYSDFMDDLMLQDACIKNIEEIGEKASKVSFEFRQAHPEIRWKSMIGARHHLVHDYEGVDLNVLWEVIDKDLPELVAQLETLV